MDTRMTPNNIEQGKIIIQRIAQPETAYILSPYFLAILLNVVIDDLSIKDQVNLAKTCFGLYTTFKPNLDKLAFKQLLQSVVDNENDIVKKILDKKPSLLLQDPMKIFSPKEIKEGIESQLTWQRFLAKPLEIATFRGQLEMTKLLLPYFKELENGQAEALLQWKVHELSEEEKKEKEIAYALKMKALIDVIAKETFPNGTKKDRLIDRISEETKAALSAFRKELLPDGAVTLENYPDVEQLLIASYKAYADYFSVFQNWDQRDLYCIAGLGLIQSVLTPELGKVYCEGLWDVVESNKQISRRADELKLNDDETSFYRSGRDVHSGLSFDFFVGISYQHRMRRGPNGSFGVRTAADAVELLKNYVEQEQSSLANLRENLSQEIYPNISPRK